MCTPLFAGSSVDQNGQGLPPHTEHGECQEDRMGRVGVVRTTLRTDRAPDFRYLVFGMVFTLPLNSSQLLCVHCSLFLL